MDGPSPMEAYLTGKMREQELLSEVDRVIAEGSDNDRTVLLQDWRTKSGRIKIAALRRQLDEKISHLAWSANPSDPRESSSAQDGRKTYVRVGDLLANRFVIEAQLGSGGMGTVFKALDLRRQEARDRNPYVAVKTLSLDVLNRDDSVQILQREARKAQSLSHPNIVRVYDYDRDGAILFLTMELLEGVSLESNIRSGGTAGKPLISVMPVIEQIVSALQFAHDEGIIHSDLKPANIIVLPNGRVKVIDFGISRAIPNPGALTTDRTTFEINALGALTPAYASPEMIEGDDPDPRDDVFALACIVFECLTGHHPFGRTPASMARAANLQPAKPLGLQPHQWKALQNGLRFDRSLRTPSPKQFLLELATNARPPLLGRSVIYVGALGLVAVCAIAGTTYYFHNSQVGLRDYVAAGPPAGEQGATAPDTTGRKSEEATAVASQQAQQKAAEEPATQKAKQKAADEAAAAAEQAQQKANSEVAARQAQQKIVDNVAAQKAADEAAAAQQAKQRVADEAAARQAQQKAAADAAAQQAKQRVADEAAARQAQQKAAADAAAQQAKQKAADEAAARQAQQKAAADVAAQQAKQKAADEAAAAAAARENTQKASRDPWDFSPVKGPTGKFDGNYSGRYSMVGLWNIPSCVPSSPERSNLSITVAENHFDRKLLGALMSVNIAANGNFTGVGEASYGAVQLSGKVDGQKLSLDYNNRNCHYHADLTRSQ